METLRLVYLKKSMKRSYLVSRKPGACQNEARTDLINNSEQCGKEFTIYCFKENRPSREWETFIQEASQELANQGILPGPLPPSDEAINGSNYFSYRNDGRPSEDPFASLRINVENQPDREIRFLLRP